ncbi:MAG: peptide chain release factor N(5)-glutamine methyltransferase [Phycisphaerales bacterium]|nr:peptide chain release factor N(5)-glutamine methyltransferase [Phycisphaerales bacterium]
MSSMSDVTWTTRALLEWIESHLEARGVDGVKVVARHLVAEALGCDVMDLFTDPDRPASEEERASLRRLVARASAGEPLQQILGRSGFMLRDFKVTSDVLVPRDATESLVRAVMTFTRGVDPEDRPQPWRIADVGTGSGCIAITLALELEQSQVKAIDCSEAALAVAGANIERHGVADRVEVLHGNLLEPLQAPQHIIVSNPPYISDARWEQLDPIVRDHDPELALRAGVDGLDVVRPLIGAAPDLLEAGGLLALEVDDWHTDQVAELCTKAGLVNARVLKDAWGDDRCVLAEAPLD